MKARGVWIAVALVIAGFGFALWHKGTMWEHLLALVGSPGAQYNYGRMVDAAGDKRGALMWMSKAADGYDTRAMVWLGLAYQGGGYFAYPDPKESFYWFKQAADRNDAEGMLGLAVLYETWKGVREKDAHLADMAAVVWYTRAAEAGMEPAMERLAEIYEKGELGQGVSAKDAAYWREKVKQ